MPEPAPLIPAEAPLRLLDLPVGEAHAALEAELRELGEPAFRAKQVMAQVFRRHVRTLEAMTDLPANLRERLGERLRVGLLQLEHRSESKDGTVKYLWRLPDGLEIESVVMPTDDHLSFCVSSQVGCALHCRFCATAAIGLRRNLTAGEMIDQVLAMLDDLGRRQAADSLSVVFMGMGEPGYAMDAVLAACRTLTAPDGLGIGARHVTISTAGVVPAIRRLAEEPLQLRLAVSLHSADQERRESLMDVAKRFPLKDLLEACQVYHGVTARRITFEYAVMSGVNDSVDDAREFALFAGQVPSKINLIPYNPVEGFEAPPASSQDAVRFRREIERHYAGDVMIRRTRGRDIEAACGMLHRSRAGGSSS